jgi:hypothetical protein
LQLWNIPSLMTGKDPSGSTVPTMTMPSYFPVPATCVLVVFPSPVLDFFQNFLGLVRRQ